jgi:hypothetical protein
LQALWKCPRNVHPCDHLFVGNYDGIEPWVRAEFYCLSHELSGCHKGFGCRTIRRRQIDALLIVDPAAAVLEVEVEARQFVPPEGSSRASTAM